MFSRASVPNVPDKALAPEAKADMFSADIPSLDASKFN